jgi:hypothetical protein
VVRRAAIKKVGSKEGSLDKKRVVSRVATRKRKSSDRGSPIKVGSK